MLDILFTMEIYFFQNFMYGAGRYYRRKVRPNEKQIHD